MSQKRNYNSTKTKSKSKGRRKRKKVDFSRIFLVLLLIAVVVAILFVACKKTDDSSEESSAGEIGKTEESGEKVSEIHGENTNSLDESHVSDTSINVELPSEDTSIEDTSDLPVDSVGSEFSTVAWFIKENGARYASYAAKNPNYTKEQVVTYVNIGLDGAYYTNTRPAKAEDGNFILLNKYSYVDKNYTPKDLVELDSACKVSGKSVKLVKEAADAFARLSADALALEYHIIGMSGYRTYSYQESLYNNYVKNYSKEKADTFSARPGYSEHHTGLALDVQTDTVSYNNFGQTNEYAWLLDNAHKYGFVIHYTEENQWITGYMPEEWHIRYLGVEAATYIYENNISIDEYLVMYGSNGPEAAG